MIEKQNGEVVLKGKMSLLGLSPMNGKIIFKVTQEKVELFADILSESLNQMTVSFGITTVSLDYTAR
ncbi:hypothetical protein [Paenibacillus terrae]|uniref:hypothetical protein n=1 Tax=Paenibacillus terrae TaxID=159743 RepID=UPI000ABB97C6|nr:hypothetical protein [Paenibacillus terrae]